MKLTIQSHSKTFAFILEEEVLVQKMYLPGIQSEIFLGQGRFFDINTLW